MTKAIFLDRDGVINHLVERVNGKHTAPWNLDEFRFIDGIQEACKLFRENGYKLLVVTNQPDVENGRGPLTYDDLDTMHLMIKKWLRIENIYYSEDRGSDTYKPNNGMIETLCKENKVDRSSTYIVGDSWKDIVAGHKSKLTTIFLGKDYTSYTSPEKYSNIEPDYVVGNLLQAACLIVELEKYD